MQPFTPPPLRIVVQKLDGVDDRPFNHLLTPEDIRKESSYQMLARRNAVLERRERQTVYVVLLVAVIVTGLNALLITPMARHIDLGAMIAPWVGAAAEAQTPQANVPGHVRPAATVAAAPVIPPTASATPVQPTPQASIQRDAANQLANAIQDLIAQQNLKQPVPAKAPPPAAKAPITLIPSINPLKSAPAPTAPAAPARAPLPVQDSAPAKAVAPLSIMDFFGTNTAVLLSPDGGQSMRTYRVGDALPSGEVIKAIDSVNGAVTTNQRIIKK